MKMGFRGVLCNYLHRGWLRIAQLLWQPGGEEVLCGQAEGELRSFPAAPSITSALLKSSEPFSGAKALGQFLIFLE